MLSWLTGELSKILSSAGIDEPKSKEIMDGFFRPLCGFVNDTWKIDHALRRIRKHIKAQKEMGIRNRMVFKGETE